MCAGLSGYGIMAANAAGELLAKHVTGAPLPEAYATYRTTSLAEPFQDVAFGSCEGKLSPAAVRRGCRRRRGGGRGRRGTCGRVARRGRAARRGNQAKARELAGSDVLVSSRWKEEPMCRCEGGAGLAPWRSNRPCVLSSAGRLPACDLELVCLRWKEAE